MAHDSVVIIDEIVVPKAGANVKVSNYDLAMMTGLAAMERTRKQWEDLLGAADLKIRDIWMYNESLASCLIVAVPVQKTASAKQQCCLV